MADLRFSTRALACLRGQDDWLRPRNPAAADAVLTGIEGLCGLIADFPEMGRRIEATRLRYHITRKYRYRIVYRIAADGIEIIDIRHPCQGP